ncbi:MAG TPA: hypothetical protein PLP21_13355 [Pyrinomonadaceae bacterium]|nr:hypothetical protein [Pyrinomonadaceae bacterium]
MRKSALFVFAFLFSSSIAVSGQVTGSGQPAAPIGDPIASIATDLRRMSTSVQTLNERLQNFVDKFEKLGGLSFTEKQLELVLGMELLVRAEQLIATHQKTQIELTEKLNETRGKLAQVDVDLRPRTIDRSVALVGTTETEELRDNRRQKLSAERQSLSQLMSQIQDGLTENNEKLRTATILANNLRRQYLPMIDREMFRQ